MLKMTIDNEEVVSKNNFTIKEEMLSPSSTILNNTYPKTWEDDKNYTSRFYYPKDYAKLDIQNFSITPEEAGTTIQVNGSATLTDVDTTKESRVLSLKGQTSQTGTPTPSSPIPVNVVSGDNYIDICGKNLANPNNIYLGKSINGNDGTLFNLNTRTTLYQIQVKPNTSYNANLSSNYYIGNMVYYKKDKSFLETQSSSWASTKSLTTPSNAYYVSFAMKRTDDGAMTQSELEALHLQLESGTATTYEPYIGNSYPIYLGVENLLENNQTTQTINGVTFTVNEDKSVTLNGTSTATTDLYLVGGASQYIDLGLTTGTYNLNGCVGGSGTTYMLYVVQNRSGSLYYYQSVASEGLNISVQTGDTFRIFIRVMSGQTLNNVTIKPQLEKGSMAHTYTPYGENIELCKIGTYQDYIYKDNGSWYLHKEIGKVVLDGSEDWSKSSNTSVDRFIRSSTIPKATQGISNYFSVVTSLGTIVGTFYFNENQQVVNYSSYGTTTLATFKTWLSSNKPIIYYVLATPTNTLIEDTTLISQLDALESQ